MGNIKEEEFDIEDPTHTGYSLVEYDLYAKLGLTIRKNLMNDLFEIVSIKTGYMRYTGTLKEVVKKANILEEATNTYII